MNNVGSYQNNIDKRLKKLHMTIDSRQRNKKIYQDPNKYMINLDNNNRLKNVNSIRIIEAMIPYSQYLINDNNKYIDIMQNGVITSIKLNKFNPIKTTTSSRGEDFATYLKTQLTTFITDIIFNDNTNKLTIKVSSEITILFETGDNSNCSPIEVIGSNKEDLLILPGVGKELPNVINLDTTKFIDIGIEEIPDITNKLMIERDINKFKFKRIPFRGVFGTDEYFRTLEQLPYNYFTPMEFTKFTITLYDDKGFVYESNGKDNYFIFEMTMLSDTSPENVNFFPPDPNIKKEIEINKTEIDIEKETKINYFDLDSNNIKENFKPSLNDNETSIDDIINKKDDIINKKDDIINNIPNKIINKKDITSKVNNNIIKKIEVYIKENKLSVIGISIFLIIFLMIFSKRK